MSAPPRETSPRIVIIGAGFSGIGMAIQLERAGFRDYTIFERADEVGGTWRDNTYPGAACDVPSHLYSLSFEPNADWTRLFAGAHEIQAYLVGLVEKWKLRDRIRLGESIDEASFDAVRGEWTLVTDSGESVRARVVISCCGGLVDPAFPKIEGLGDFAGPAFHTARWRHDVPLEGKRVAVIGTGASAVQVVPAVAESARHVRVFQRTPAWVLPRMDAPVAEKQRQRFSTSPWRLWLRRMRVFWASELRGPLVWLDSKRLSAPIEKLSRRFLRSQVSDPELRRKLTPDFQFGCKRILISDDYWASFERDNVALETEAIARITPRGVETADGRTHEADVLVYATGFEVGFRSPPFEVRGLGGRRLADVWAEGATAYKGVAISGFPNWFVLMGPNTGPGHTSVLVYTEAQMAHVLGALRRLRDEGLRYLDVRRSVQERYNAGLQKRMSRMVWKTCESWYVGPDGSNHSLYPGPASEYVLRTRRFDRGDYEAARF